MKFFFPFFLFTLISQKSFAFSYDKIIQISPLREKTLNYNSPSIGWHFEKINLNQQILQNSSTSKVLKVAIIDSGIDWFHPALKNKLFVNKKEIPENDIDDDGNGYIDDVHGYNFILNNGNTLDDNGHGTHISGIIAADCEATVGACGILKNVLILPLKFLSSDGSGITSNAVRAIDYAIKMNVDIINASWGNQENYPDLEDAIRRANARGIIFVTAAGNYQGNNDIVPFYPASYNYQNVISVGASDELDSLLSLSNSGSKTVTVVAPGKEIVSTTLMGGYRSLSGTSMASPIVTGLVGLLIQSKPAFPKARIKDVLIQSCDRSFLLEDKSQCHGRVNFNKAFQFIKNL